MGNKLVPVNVITGALGAGKTTVILNLIKQLPDDYKMVWLKNEYGDVNIDSELARESNIETKEVLNGCICCVLIGRLGDAVAEIIEQMQPDRLIIETAGTAYPYPIIDRLSKLPRVELDSLCTVIDALNFEVFHDKNQLAKQQAKYVDLVIVNKVTKVEEQQMEAVMDEVFEMYLSSAKVKTSDGFVEKDLIMGIDSDLLQKLGNLELHHDHLHDHELEAFGFEDSTHEFNDSKLTSVIESLDSSDFFRIKGIVRTGSGYKLLNCVMGKIDWQLMSKYSGPTKINFIGRGIAAQAGKIQENINQTRLN